MSRRHIPAGYPSKPMLTDAEATRMLESGPPISWFEPWAVLGVLMPGITEHPYGYYHVHQHGDTYDYDFAAWDTLSELAWGLDSLWARHADGEWKNCQGVMYFAPSEPLRLLAELEDELVSLATAPGALYIVTFTEDEGDAL